MSYVARFPNDDSKLNLGNLEVTSFPFNGDRFPESRSLSPTSTTPSTSSSTSILPLSYQYPFPDQPSTLAQDTFRRSSHNEMTLQGGTPNIPFVPGTDTVRYHVGSRQSISMPDQMALPVVRSGSASESQQDHGISNGDCASYSNSRLRSRRSIKLCLYQLRKMSHVPLLSLKLKPSVTPGALVQKRKNRQRLLRVLYVMRWQLVVSSLLINDGNIHADDANTTFFSCITVDSFPTLHGGMVYQYDRNIFVLLDPDTVCPVHYTVYPTIFQSLYK